MAEKFEWIEENSKRKRERTSRRNNEAPTCEVSVRNSKTDGGNHDSTGESRQSSNRGSRKSKKSSVSSRRRLRVDGDDCKKRNSEKDGDAVEHKFDDGDVSDIEKGGYDERRPYASDNDFDDVVKIDDDVETVCEMIKRPGLPCMCFGIFILIVLSWLRNWAFGTDESLKKFEKTVKNNHVVSSQQFLPSEEVFGVFPTPDPTNRLHVAESQFERNWHASAGGNYAPFFAEEQQRQRSRSIDFQTESDRSVSWQSQGYESSIPFSESTEATQTFYPQVPAQEAPNKIEPEIPVFNHGVHGVQYDSSSNFVQDGNGFFGGTIVPDNKIVKAPQASSFSMWEGIGAFDTDSKLPEKGGVGRINRERQLG